MSEMTPTVKLELRPVMGGVGNLDVQEWILGQYWIGEGGIEIWQPVPKVNEPINVARQAPQPLPG